MEENQNTSLFGLGIDPITRAHLSETARWARFLSIVGFVIIGLIVLVGIFAGSILGSMASGMGGADMGGVGVAGGMMGSMFVVIYILVAALYFFPCLFLFRFANKMKVALAANDQETLNSSFHNLKRLFKFVGILMIIILAFYGIVLVFGLLGAGMSRF